MRRALSDRADTGTGFELEFSLSLASVPAWAPVGLDAADYRLHLLGDDSTTALPETLLHHADRWGHVAEYDDFVDLLSLDRFEADALASLAERAGADTVLVTASSSDGWCWWDSDDTRSVARRGPTRDIVAEMIAAARRQGLRPGVGFSAARHASPHHLLAELIERYDIEVVAGDWSPSIEHEMHGVLVGASRDLRVDVGGIDDGARRQARPDEPATDDRPDPSPVWSVATGSGFGPNRADPPARRLQPADLILRYVKAVVGGGRLRVVVPLDADGVPDDHDTDLLQRVGEWIHRFAPVLAAAPAWAAPSEDSVVVGREQPTHAIVRAECLLVPGLATGRARVTGVAEIGWPADAAADVPANLDLAFDQDDDGLHLATSAAGVRGRSPATDPGLPRVLRLDVGASEPAAQLFAADDVEPVGLGPLLAGCRPGDIVHLGAGRYVGPAEVPPGVTVRGLGDRRTTVVSDLTLGAGARLEHLRAGDVTIPSGAGDVLVLGCTTGAVAVSGDRATVRASRTGSIGVTDAVATTISRCRIAPGDRRSTAIEIVGGQRHEIDTCTIAEVSTAIEIIDAEDVTIRGCTIRDVTAGVRLLGTERAHACASRIERASRSFDVVGGLSTLIDGNVVVDADSGVVVRDGAVGGVVSGNYWERCRVGALVWNAEDVKVTDNVIESLGEPDHDIRHGPT